LLKFQEIGTSDDFYANESLRGAQAVRGGKSVL